MITEKCLIIVVPIIILLVWMLNSRSKILAIVSGVLILMGGWFFATALIHSMFFAS